MPKAKLTAKQKIFVTEVAKGKSGTQAALVAYDTQDENTAHVIASENLQKPTIKEALAPILAKHDINLDTAIAPIGRGLKDEDVKTQMQASDRALKLMGVNQTEVSTVTNFYQISNEIKNELGL